MEAASVVGPCSSTRHKPGGSLLCHWRLPCTSWLVSSSRASSPALASSRPSPEPPPCAVEEAACGSAGETKTEKGEPPTCLPLLLTVKR